MPKLLSNAIWFAVAVLGTLAVATIALHRGEKINALWLVVAAICVYAVGYRFYSKFIAAESAGAGRHSCYSRGAPGKRA